MATLNVNDKTYDMDKLPKEAQAQVTNLRFVEAEIARQTALLAVLQTARNTYTKALLPHLKDVPEKSAKLQ